MRYIKVFEEFGNEEFFRNGRNGKKKLMKIIQNTKIFLI